MKKDRVKPSIFPTNEDSVMVEIDILLRDLNNELENNWGLNIRKIAYYEQDCEEMYLS